MTVSRSWLAYTSFMRRPVETRALLSSESTGVMPLPALKCTIGRSLSRSTKRPSGGSTWMRSPGRSSSLNQFETRPSSMRLTVTRWPSSHSGELHSE